MVDIQVIPVKQLGWNEICVYKGIFPKETVGQHRGKSETLDNLST